jgi:hypothetical protein
MAGPLRESSCGAIGVTVAQFRDLLASAWLDNIDNVSVLGDHFD